MVPIKYDKGISRFRSIFVNIKSDLTEKKENTLEFIFIFQPDPNLISVPYFPVDYNAAQTAPYHLNSS